MPGNYYHLRSYIGSLLNRQCHIILTRFSHVLEKLRNHCCLIKKSALGSPVIKLRFHKKSFIFYVSNHIMTFNGPTNINNNNNNTTFYIALYIIGLKLPKSALQIKEVVKQVSSIDFKTL